jgi:4-amino-4-deoxy-L-arabinose transferase-like glycosyltransferase
LHWQDSHVDIVAGKTALSGVFNRYHKEARRMLDEGGILFPREPPANGDAILAHSPGYAILLAGAYSVPGDPLNTMWFLQIVCDAIAAVFVFLLASELLSAAPALIGAMLVAVSPHLAHYSIVLCPIRLRYSQS